MKERKTCTESCRAFCRQARDNPKKITDKTLTKPPRALIVLLHHFRTKELILCLAWQHSGKLSYNGHNIAFYPDLSADLLQRSAAFMPVKKLSGQAHLTYSVVHPATLRFKFQGVEQEFKSPSEAKAFIEEHMSIHMASSAATSELSADLLLGVQHTERFRMEGTGYRVGLGWRTISSWLTPSPLLS